jgi:hypothetical protein
MAKKVSEANKGIQALAKEAPEVVEKMGYVMQMGSKEINSSSNFSSKSAMLMSKSPMYMGPDIFNLGGLPDVSNVPGKIYGNDTSSNSLTPTSRKIEVDPVNISGKFKSKEDRFGKDSEVVKQKSRIRQERERIKGERLKRRANRMAKRNK